MTLTDVDLKQGEVRMRGKAKVSIEPSPKRGAGCVPVCMWEGGGLRFRLSSTPQNGMNINSICNEILGQPYDHVARDKQHRICFLFPRNIHHVLNIRSNYTRCQIVLSRRWVRSTRKTSELIPQRIIAAQHVSLIATQGSADM